MFARLTPRGALLVMLLSAIAFGHPGVANVLAEEEHDSFPISTFGMFSKKRPEVHGMPYIRAFKRDGSFEYLRSHHIARGGMNQTLHMISRTQRRSRKASQELCRKVAEKVARRRRFAEVTHLEIVRGYYRPEVLFGERNDEPIKERIYARCRVKHQQEEREGERSR